MKAQKCKKNYERSNIKYLWLGRREDGVYEIGKTKKSWQTPDRGFGIEGLVAVADNAKTLLSNSTFSTQLKKGEGPVRIIVTINKAIY